MRRCSRRRAASRCAAPSTLCCAVTLGCCCGSTLTKISVSRASSSRTGADAEAEGALESKGNKERRAPQLPCHGGALAERVGGELPRSRFCAHSGGAGGCVRDGGRWRRPVISILSHLYITVQFFGLGAGSFGEQEATAGGCWLCLMRSSPQFIQSLTFFSQLRTAPLDLLS